jgi:hypothetical protein
MELGFKDKLQAIKPDVPEEKPKKEKAPPLERRSDAVAERNGFKSREPVQKIVRRKDAEPTGNLAMRVPLSQYNRFVQWAMDNRLSYQEGLTELMDKAGIP